MEELAYRLFYDSVLDFKRAAALVESEIRSQGIRCDSNDAVQGMNGRRHHDMWVSMKAVSHFNLGTALELMLKLLLCLNNVPLTNIDSKQQHKLTILYNALPEPERKQLESRFRESIKVSGMPTLIMFNDPSAQPPPPTPGILRCEWFFEYLDKYVKTWQKRYSWEHAKDSEWRYYLDDITLVEDLIDRVMKNIPRDQ